MPEGALAGDVAFFEGDLWIIDSQNNVITKFNPADSTFSNQIFLHTINPSGLTSAGQSLWYLDQQSKMIYQLDAATGSYLDSTRAPGIAPTGISWDGARFWIADMRSNRLYLFDFSHRSVIQIIPLDSRFPQGISYDGENIWVCSLEAKQLQKIALVSDKNYRILSSQRALLRYTVTIRNSGSGIMETKTYIACPTSSLSQFFEDTVRFKDPPLDFFKDKYGQKIAYYYHNINAGSQRVYQYQVPATINAIRYFLNPDSVGSREQMPDSIANLYTGDGEKYQINDSVIQQAAAEAVGDETNLYWQVRKIHDFVIDHIYYNNDSRWDAAPQVLQQGHGSCSEYSFLFIALCRAKGIPARYEAGSHLRDELPYEDTVFHRWQQVYFPNYGWIPIDCTWDDRDDMVEQALYFGAKSKSTFTTTIGGGGATGLWWTYNSSNSTSGGDMDREKKMEWLEITTAVEEITQNIYETNPSDFRLIYNYPNPFNSSTTIVFDLNESSLVEFSIYNLQGQKIWDKKDWRSSGNNFCQWNGTDFRGNAVSSGSYILNLKTKSTQQSIQMFLVK
ncbi:MAG: T9SS type A sorting domain-containing protein [Calditrichaeota bacterium]|nr:T9SS type A sorting domain-containing protein [Calditrichota bacterium]